MPRPLKPYKVDDVRSPNGYTTADVMFDRDRKVFFVEITPGDKESRVEGDLLLDVKQKAVAALAASQKYDWTPLIEISVSEAWYNNSSVEGASIRFEFRRFERSPNPIYPNRFVERPHVLDLPDDPGPRRTQRESHRDISPYSGRDEIGPAVKDERDALLPYRQDVWDGLVAIQQSIDEARQKLVALLQRKDAAHLLMSAGRSQAAQRLRGIALLASGDDQ
jgi:hypothetical protein